MRDGGFDAGDNWTTLLTEPADVLRLAPEIEELLHSSGKAGDLTLLPAYYLARLRGYGKAPALVAVRHGERLAGVVYGMESRVLGARVGYVVAGDACGEGAMVAPFELEPAVMAAAVRHWATLRRIHTIFVRNKIEGTTVAKLAACLAEQGSSGDRVHYAAHPVRNHLVLAATYPEFLASVGYHTRRNLRYYRRHGERRGWTFAPAVSPAEAQQALAELLPLARHGANSRHWPYFRDVLHSVSGARFAALRDVDGQWLSLIATWRRGDQCTVLLQLNHAGFSRESVSTVLRACLIENLIAQRVGRLVFLGGCSAGLARYAVPEVCRSLRIEPRRPMWDLVKLAAFQILHRLSLRKPLQRLALVASPPSRGGPGPGTPSG
ncbi:MAG: GNAT family N-acetyltransferase [Terriglobales bacterium]